MPNTRKPGMFGAAGTGKLGAPSSQNPLNSSVHSSVHSSVRGGGSSGGGGDNEAGRGQDGQRRSLSVNFADGGGGGGEGRVRSSSPRAQNYGTSRPF